MARNLAISEIVKKTVIFALIQVGQNSWSIFCHFFSDFTRNHVILSFYKTVNVCPQNLR